RRAGAARSAARGGARDGHGVAAPAARLEDLRAAADAVDRTVRAGAHRRGARRLDDRGARRGDAAREARTAQAHADRADGPDAGPGRRHDAGADRGRARGGSHGSAAGLSTKPASVALRIDSKTVSRLPALMLAMGVSLAAGLFIEPWVGFMSAGLSTALILRPFQPVAALATFPAPASVLENQGGGGPPGLPVGPIGRPFPPPPPGVCAK